MKYALIGYGRMGKAVDGQALARGHDRTAILDPVHGTLPDGGIDREALVGAQVAFEFTLPDVAERNVAALLEAGVPVVCGTTGWKPGASLRAVLESSPAGVVIAPNFSVGVNLFFRLVDRAARLYGTLGLHEPFVHEIHHREKADAPSGTARRLATILKDADSRIEGVQEGNPVGKISPNTLHVTSTRVGSEPGTHTVGFDGEHDRVTVRHSARSRDGFAAGAVLAAEWLGSRRGLHSFDEVLDEILENGRGPEED